MSANVAFTFRVTGIEDEARARAVVEELRELMRDESIGRQVTIGIRREDGVHVVTGGTDFPVSVSRAHLWCPEFEKSVAWYAKEAAPSAVCAVEWSHPDEQC
ncbi:hypothetical protein CP980_20590 [Streptomyces vinaceus]|uniref:Uncharacterized protein n=1 Tax=Streptomyces vinaceus TaxID=1960 RepID=A0A5J6JI57_STRVI|nr:hypothetical protein [Streptomyces vinaceus]QEV47168.1 hypothetical protein CP980_20590 [Streptomyces vinaceus]GHE56147.1 hypothetical protein GCM10017778_45740 [Streptomyces vinaceus]